MIKLRERGNGYKIGDTLRRFKVLGWQFRIGYEWHFVGRCKCGTIKVVRIGHAIAGRVKSCGCLNSQLSAARTRSRATHKATGTRLHRLWLGMKRRCVSDEPAKARNYKNRGIKVCDRWAKSFKSFRDWALANGYKPGLQIDRYPNQNGNYAPNNCRFVTCKVNSRNSRHNHLVAAWGETKTATEWTEDNRCHGITPGTLVKRLNAGMSPELAISSPSRNWRQWKRKADSLVA